MTHLQGTLAMTLGLVAGERVELAHMDPRNGDYRIFSLMLDTAPHGGETLSFELHRQAPGLGRYIFPVLSCTVSAPDAHGQCRIDALESDAAISAYDLSHHLPDIARISASLRNRQRPEERLLQPFLSERGKILWTQPLHEGMAS